MIDCMKDCKYAHCTAGCKHWQAELDKAKLKIQGARTAIRAIHNDAIEAGEFKIATRCLKALREV